jgi:uncharacterized membrane protein YgdD (TMEM256/DUF423 family)
MASDETRIVAAQQMLAGLLGAAGVAVAAAAAHRGGGDITAIAANMMLIHAVAILAILAGASPMSNRRIGLLLGTSMMLVGTLLFSGELALHGLTGAQPWPTAAPIGGTLMMLGWLCVSASMVLRLVHRI